MRSSDTTDSAPELIREAQHLQALEGNPLSEAELDMFAMFERENWTHERRRAYILAQFKPAASAAE